jgi:hypothetical protein
MVFLAVLKSPQEPLCSLFTLRTAQVMDKLTIYIDNKAKCRPHLKKLTGTSVYQSV